MAKRKKNKDEHIDGICDNSKCENIIYSQDNTAILKKKTVCLKCFTEARLKIKYPYFINIIPDGEQGVYEIIQFKGVRGLKTKLKLDEEQVLLISGINDLVVYNTLNKKWWKIGKVHNIGKIKFKDLDIYIKKIKDEG